MRAACMRWKMMNFPTALTKLRQNDGGTPSHTFNNTLIKLYFSMFYRYQEAGMDAAYILAYATQGDAKMIELNHGGILDITLQEDALGRDSVVLALQTPGCELNLTPHQARVLATELIMAVNRAEVRNNLKHSQNMVRSGQPQTSRRGLFQMA